jgi:hypothetical protein
MTSNTDIRCTVKKPRSALETDKDLHILATNTSHQVKSPMLEMNMAKVEERKPEKSEEHEEIDVTHTDRNMQHKKEESKQKLVNTKRRVCNLGKVRTTVKRPRPAFDAHETPHTFTTSPTARKVLSVRSSTIPMPYSPSLSNLARLSSAPDQEDLKEEVTPLHMERVRKDNSYDSAYIVEEFLSHRMKMIRDMMKKRKYEALAK